MDRRSNNSNNRFSRPNNNSNNNNGRDSYRPAPHPIKVDREKTCPFLLRVFVSQGIHRQENDYKTLPLQDEHQIYTWRDTTLKELILLLRDTSNNLRSHPFARYSIRIVYFDTSRNSFHSREFGSVLAKDLVESNNKDKEREVVNDRERERGVGFDRSSSKTFEEGRFVIGDYIDIAYYPNGTPASHNPFDRSIQPPASILGRSLDSRNNSSATGGRGGSDNRRASETAAKRDTIWASSAPSGPRAGNGNKGTGGGDGSGAPGAWGRMPAGDRGGNDRGGDRNDKGGDRNGDRNFAGNGRNDRDRNDRDRNDQGRDNARDGGRDGGRNNGRDNGRDSKAIPGEGWGARRDRENGLGNKRDEPPHRQDRRRSSRSRSPAPRQSRRDRSNSPAPRKNDNGGDSKEKDQDRAGSAGMDVE